MAAPNHVPDVPTRRVRGYASPPRRRAAWVADRPGDLGGGGQELLPGMGRQGPDQGFIFTLTGLFDDRLHLGEIERADADAGCIAVALKRSALYGRAPVAADLQMAYAAFGFFDAAAPDELVAWREIAFAGLAHGHHYAERRRLADRISVGSLAVTPEALESAYRRDWQALLGLGD